MIAVRVGAKRSISAVQLASRDAGATRRLVRRVSSRRRHALASPATAPAPASSCRGPCHRRGTRPGRGWRADAAIARRPADRGATSPSARRRDPVAPVGPGSRRPASVFASHGPATTDDQSGAVAATMSPGTCAPARRRIASPKERPSFAAAVSTARNSSSIRLSLSRSTSTQRPRTRCRPFDAASSCSISAVGQRFAVEADAHLEVEQRIRAETRRRLAPDGGRDLRTWWTIGAPCGRYAHDDAGGLEAGDIGQQLKRLGGRPPQRVIDLARLDHRLQPRTLGGGALDRQEQREQLRLVGGACVFAQRAAERQVLRPGLRRQVGRVGRQKRERRVIIPAVLGEVEVDAADEMPCRALTLEKLPGPTPSIRRARIETLSAVAVQSVSRTEAVRYSAPVIGGAAAASDFELAERGRRYWRVSHRDRDACRWS